MQPGYTDVILKLFQFQLVVRYIGRARKVCIYQSPFGIRTVSFLLEEICLLANRTVYLGLAEEMKSVFIAFTALLVVFAATCAVDAGKRDAGS